MHGTPFNIVVFCMQYKRIGIPIKDYEVFVKIQPILGYRSFSEFVVEAVRDHLTRKRVEAEVRLEKIYDKKVEGVFT